MHYLIEYDTRSVVCKSEDRKELIKYLIHNELGEAFALISSEKDLQKELSLRELREVYENIALEELASNLDEIHASQALWVTLEYEDIPVFSEQIGDKLLFESEKVTKKKPRKENKKARSIKSKQEEPRKDIIYVIGSVKPKRMAAKISKVLNYIEDNWGEANEQELFKVLENENGKSINTLESYVNKKFIDIKIKVKT